MKLIVVSGMMLAAAAAQAAPSVSGWTPIYRGIDYATGTNPASYNGTLSMFAYRVDLQDPDIRLFITPPVTNNYIEGSRETLLQTPSEFLSQYQVQVAINSVHFSPGGYNLPSGTPAQLHGVTISEGKVVSSQTTSNDAQSAILFTTNNTPSFVAFNWPPTSTAGVYNAVAGMYPILINGVNIGSNYLSAMSDSIHQPQPRTGFGLSADGRYLFLVAIDGRSQSSTGAVDYETAEFLQLLGAASGMNMDGGGSTVLVKGDECNIPFDLNDNSFQYAVGRPGSQRPIGCNFGVYARSATSIINDVRVAPATTIATVTWTTTEPAAAVVEFGPTPALGSSVARTSLQTNHAIVLTGLRAPSTNYYRITCTTSNNAQFVRPACTFVVKMNPPPPLTNVNFVSVSPLTNGWRFNTNNLYGTGWMNKTYDDSAWPGPGPALLYVEDNGNVSPKNTPLPTMPGQPDGVPPAGGRIVPTYYFRTHFSFTNTPTGALLQFSNNVDDGAVFYLNGAEIYRLRMPPPPTPITFTTLATGYACSNYPAGGGLQGDACSVCPDVFAISGPVVNNNLATGDNVLAVEVHNYSLGSLDVVFGSAVMYGVAPAFPTNTLVVLSSRPDVGVAVAVSPADGYAHADGSTPFERFFGSGTAVELSAPTNSPDGVFLEWQLDGTNFSTSPIVSIVSDGNHVVNAVYGDPAPPPPPPLAISWAESLIRVEWTGTGFTLQEAPTPLGDWTDLAGTAVTNQFILSPTNGGSFYRLRNGP